jgi:hypothetical protein
LVTVTTEPLPTRLGSIARGTGEVDAVYHIAFDALAASVAARANPEQAEAWREVTGQRRVLSYEMLIGTLACCDPGIGVESRSCRQVRAESAVPSCGR